MGEQGEVQEDPLDDIGTMGDGPDGIPDVRGDLDTEEEEDYHNEADVQINATIPNAGKPRSQFIIGWRTTCPDKTYPIWMWRLLR